MQIYSLLLATVCLGYDLTEYSNSGCTTKKATYDYWSLSSCASSNGQGVELTECSATSATFYIWGNQPSCGTTLPGSPVTLNASQYACAYGLGSYWKVNCSRLSGTYLYIVIGVSVFIGISIISSMFTARRRHWWGWGSPAVALAMQQQQQNAMYQQQQQMMRQQQMMAMQQPMMMMPQQPQYNMMMAQQQPMTMTPMQPQQGVQQQLQQPPSINMMQGTPSMPPPSYQQAQQQQPPQAPARKAPKIV